MHRVLRLFAIAMVLAVNSSANALTDEDIERRFLQLEQENNTLRKKLEQVESLLKQQGIDPSSPLIEQRITANEKSKLEVARRMDRFEQSAGQDRDRIKINGFLSAGFTTNDESGGLKHRPYDFNMGSDFESDAVLGVQMNFRINDQAKVVTQIVANGWDGWDADIGWAYLAYELDQHWEVRAGRMRLPIYLFSESLDVGYTYPWVRPPLSLYITEISDYDGFDVTYRFNDGQMNHRVSAYYGGYAFEEKSVNLDAKVEGDDVLGLNWTTYWQDWTFRLAYTHLRTTASFKQQDFNRLGGNFGVIDTDALVPGSTVTTGDSIFFEGQLSENIDYYTYGAAYDDGDWLAILEVSVQDVSEGNFIGDEVLGVLTLGHRFDKWMPYGGYGREYYKDALPRIIYLPG
ncbi:hypothetical protein [Oceanicoccus sp. KOV_DT_Chl]|uniref:hypothetical protein n=1 Tax=Oceanicoccus sp. KOV_DT_Chl TaxID=1904639 RepID=UPI0011AFC117|nr:hypothetical protein [Oceanicoccus sp. KOV_DT_Chl]